MATSTQKQPVTEAKTRKAAQQKPAAKPAAEQPAANVGLTLHDLAKEVGSTDDRALRRRIRKIKGGKAVVGQGGRYHWSSKSDPDFKELVAQLTSK